MRTLKQNKQKMFYAKVIGQRPKYKLEDGKIVYIDVDGVLTPVETGGYTTLYDIPVEFRANISSTLASAAFKPFGVDNSANMATVCCDKGSLNLKIGDIVWVTSTIGYIDDEKTIPNEETADFVVKGVDDVGLTNDLYLLQRLNTEESNNKE